MNTKTTLICLFLILFQLSSNAQKENNVWMFGSPGVGIDFNVTPPAPIASSIVSNEGSATVCDKEGNLLFYSNGINIWDKTHTIMPNGYGLLGVKLKSSTQGVAIVPVAFSTKLFFLFTVEENEDSSGKGYLRYSIIDMTLNGGNGDVVSGKKNILLDSNMSEKMITAPACNGVWIITHHIDSSIFYAYKITSSSTIETPVVSRIGSLGGLHKYLIGEIKISPDRSKIALGNTGIYFSNVELFDFDWKSGKLSGYYPIDSSKNAYSVEFSPDNSKLYVLEFGIQINQFNISLLPSLTSVYYSKYKLLHLEGIVGMRGGPDGKIYFKQNLLTEYISCIHNPNVSGPGCKIEVDIPTLKFPQKSHFYLFGNPVSIVSDDMDSLKIVNTDTTICDGDSILLLGDHFYNAFVWNDGDTNSVRSIKKAGIFWRKSFNGCQTRIDSINIILKTMEINNILGSDTTICDGEKITCRISAENASIQWSTGSQSPEITIDKAGRYSVVVNRNGCISTDEIEVFSKFCQNCILVPNAFTPNNDGINDDFRVKAFCPYLHYELMIFNRFGEKVFSTDSPNQTWNGQLNQQDLSSGVYYYFIKVKFDYPEAKEEIFKGDITLIR